MDVQESKVFSTMPQSRLSRGFDFVFLVVYCLFLSQYFYKFIHPYVLDGVIPKAIELMFLFFILSPVVAVFFPRKAVIISVNSEAILFQKKNIKLNSIRIVRLIKVGASHHLLIETNESQMALGAEFNKEQVNEMYVYILEQIRINYPENYNDVITEHYEVEKFWRT